MRSLVYPTSLRPLGLFPLALAAIALLVAFGCSSKKHGTQLASIGPKDAGDDFDGGVEIDAAGLPQPRSPSYDAAAIIPGDPPPELADQSCAVDTNKLYRLATTMHQPEPAALGVDLVDSRFGVAYIDQSKQCTDAVYLAQLEGPSGLGMPDVSTALDPCSTIDHAAVAYSGQSWLVATVDARKDERDLWVQPYDGKTKYTAQRITMSLAQRSEVAIAPFGSDASMLAWVEQDQSSGATTLYARPLSALGEPQGDAVPVEQSDSLHYRSLSLSQVGKDYVALGYHRFDDSGRSEIVMQVLAGTTGVPDRDPWVLTTDAGAYGSVAISADEGGGGVIYSIIQGTSEQLWFQQLGPDGRAAPVTSGGRSGGGVDATRVVGPPLNAIDASLAKLPVGFAVAYRALPGGNVLTPRIRTHFLDRFGRQIFESDVALAEQVGGRTAIAAGYDGRVVLSWSDQTEEGKTTVTAVKLPCVGGG